MKYPKCAGIIVFNDNQTIIVSSNPTKFSFPKGKKNRGILMEPGENYKRKQALHRRMYN